MCNYLIVQSNSLQEILYLRNKVALVHDDFGYLYLLPYAGAVGEPPLQHKAD